MKTDFNQSSIAMVSTYANLSELFLSEVKALYEKDRFLFQVCGPIASNEGNTMKQNLENFAKAIDVLSKLGLSMVDQIPYEPKMQEIKKVREGELDGKYDETILTDFYLPLFESGYISCLVFLPHWRKSFGSRWEYLQGKKRGMKLLELVTDWETLVVSGDVTSIGQITQPILENSNTDWQYEKAVNSAKSIFEKKAFDYGGLVTFALLRPLSVVDQLFIKAMRIRTLQDLEQQNLQSKVGEDKSSEFKALINYSIMSLIREKYGEDTILSMNKESVLNAYDITKMTVKDLMMKKNHDYGEAWREMSQMGFTDLILAKILRMKSIIKNDGKTLISEGLDANLHDIINYAIFALILIDEGKEGHTE